MSKKKIKLTGWQEIRDSVSYTLELEYENKKYSWQIVYNYDDSDTNFYNSEGVAIDIPDWTDDLDFWELFDKAKEDID